MDRKFGVSGCKLLSAGWINSGVLLYRTPEKAMAPHSSTLAGKHVPCPVTNHKGKEDGSECMYVHLIHFCAVEINAMSKSTILQ